METLICRVCSDDFLVRPGEEEWQKRTCTNCLDEQQAPVKTRNLRADLAVCNAATPGPWLVDSPSNQVRQPKGSKRRRITTPPDASGIKDAAFIAAAREGWPEAIRRALAAEAEVERLTRFIESESECAIETAQEREVLVRTLSDIISAIDRGNLYKTKMSNGLDDMIHRAREALRK